MLLDTHHHFWIYRGEEYGWMDDTMEILKRDYLPPDLERELERANVYGTVAVQARQKVEETRWLLDLAGKHPFIKGVVGWLDLCSPDLPWHLERFGGERKLVGVRHLIHDEPDDDFMLREDFMKGIGSLMEYDLTFDLLLFPRHLKHAAELVKKFPGQRFVLDHLSKPGIRLGVMHPWKEDIATLASSSNVWCKISGMVTEAARGGWSQEDFLPYMQVVLDTFGTGRIMLGSDWPVCLLSGGYRDVMDIPLRFIEGLDESDREKICAVNATECYRLEI